MTKISIATFLLLFGPAVAVTKTFSNILTNGSINAEFMSTNISSLDGPKLGDPGPANDTSYDWWYFDAVSASTNASVVVVFYNSGPNALTKPYLGGPLSVDIIGTFANGTVFDLKIPASSANVEYGPDQGVSLDLVGSGFSFTGSNLKGTSVQYVVSIDSPSIGIKGTIRLDSLAPAHYTCGLNTAGSNVQLLPHIGWANAVPDAHATVDLHFTSDNNNDTALLAFSDGVGYHDKNWGDRPLVSSMARWYWGHARLGPYSLVWFDAFDPNGTEYCSGYVAASAATAATLADSSVMASSCAAGASVARAWGSVGAVPPNVTSGPPLGVEVGFDVGGGQVLRVNITTGTVMAGGQYGYSRLLGTLVGSMDGGEVYEGRALFEQFL